MKGVDRVVREPLDYASSLIARLRKIEGPSLQEVPRKGFFTKRRSIRFWLLRPFVKPSVCETCPAASCAGCSVDIKRELG